MMIAARRIPCATCHHRPGQHKASGSQPCGEGACPCRRYVDDHFADAGKKVITDAAQRRLWGDA